MTAIGYCRDCSAAVDLDSSMRCARHPRQRIEDIREVSPLESEIVKANILLERSRRLRRQLIGWLIAINGFMLLGYILMFMIGR
jgi:hypothetical protein